MKRLDNILNYWWYSLVLTPIINISVFLIPWSSGDKTIFSFMLLFIFSMCAEIYLLSRNKVDYKTLHYSFIAFVFIFSLFISFGFSKFLPQITDNKWVSSLIHGIITVLVLIIVKTIIWFWLMFFRSKMKKNADMSNKLQTDNMSLANESKELFAKYELLDQKYQELKRRYIIVKDRYLKTRESKLKLKASLQDKSPQASKSKGEVDQKKAAK